MGNIVSFLSKHPHNMEREGRGPRRGEGSEGKGRKQGTREMVLM